MTSLAKWLGGRAAAARIHYHSWYLSRRRERRRAANQQRLASANGVLRINIDSEVGLFAHLSWCVKIAAYCERHNLTPHITCTSKQYGEGGRDWFNILFDQPVSNTGPNHLAETLRIFEYEELPFYCDSSLESTLSEAARLQKKYFAVSRSVAAKVESYMIRNFTSLATIGCHFRGTDKGGIEAARIAYEEMSATLRDALTRFPPGTSIFVATDEAAFLDHIRSTFSGTRVVSAEHQRSTDGRALHFSRELHGLAHAEEALVDSLLLSRCDILIKSPSALSAWAKVFNPDLPVTLVGRPYSHKMFFPESALYSTSAK